MSSSAFRTLAARRELEGRGIDELVGIAEHAQHERVVDDFQRCQVLRLADDDLGDAHPAGLLQRLAQQRVRVLRALLRRQVVGRLEVPIVDVVAFHEIHDRDRLVLVHRGGLQIFLRQDDVAALFVLEAFDEVLPGHRLPLPLAHPLVPHRRLVARVQHPEFGTVIADGCVQLHGNRDESEGNRAFPDGARHGPLSGVTSVGARRCKVYAGLNAGNMN